MGTHKAALSRSFFFLVNYSKEQPTLCELSSRTFLQCHNLKFWRFRHNSLKAFQQHSSLELRELFPWKGSVLAASSSELEIWNDWSPVFQPMHVFLPQCLLNTQTLLVFMEKSMNTHFTGHKTATQWEELKYMFRREGLGLICQLFSWVKFTCLFSSLVSQHKAA